MPMFARRRLQAMLNEVAAGLPDRKINDLIARLEKKTDARNVIGAEMELALLWAAQQVGHLTIEPLEALGEDNPDAYSDDLFGVPTFIEVTAISDESLSGEELMRKTSKKIVDFANTIRRGYGNHLHFTFHEHRQMERWGTVRKRMVPKDFALMARERELLRYWIASPHTTLRLQADELDVTITHKPHRQHHLYNYFSPLPSLAYSWTENPIANALRAKKKQLSTRPKGTLACVFLADGGCRPLRHLNNRDHLGEYKSGAELIRYFLEHEGGIDIVAVFSAQRTTSLTSYSGTLSWGGVAFCREGLPQDKIAVSISAIARQLPSPRFEGYQAKSLCQQGRYNPQGYGWYVGYRHSVGEKAMNLRFSSRVLLEYLAGRITKEHFEREVLASNMKNPFETMLSKGFTFESATLESGGLDEDDDLIVFDFKKDPAAAPFSKEG